MGFMGNYERQNLSQEIIDRCQMVSGDLREIAERAALAYLGMEQVDTLPPIDPAVNVMQKYLSVVAHCLDVAAVKGIPAEVLGLSLDGTSSPLVDAMAEADYLPIPTSILEGEGESGGLREVLDYLCGVGYVGCYVGVSEATGRLYPQAIPPCQLTVTWADADPTRIVGVEWAGKTNISGIERDIIRKWDISNPDAPSFTVKLGSGQDVTAKLYPERDDTQGAGYWWREPDGTPFIPVPVWGSPRRVWKLSYLSAGVRASLAMRLSAMGVAIDTGFPGRNVQGLKPASTTNGATGEASVAPGPGGVVVWVLGDDGVTPAHWEWTPGGNPKESLETCHLHERDVVGQLGIPLDLTATGGEPLAEEIRRQEQASARFADPMRLGLLSFFRIWTATAIRAGLAPKTSPLTGFSLILGEAELKQALETEEPEPEEPEEMEEPVETEPEQETK